MRVVDIVYYAHNDYTSPEEVVKKHKPSYGFIPHIGEKLNLQLIKHLNYEGQYDDNGIETHCFKSRNNFWYIPFKTHKSIKRNNPDIVIIQGFIFPIQLVLLKLQLPKVLVVVQHHGEVPFNGYKKLFQKLADYFINAYTFTSFGNAKAWIESKIISSREKCFEVLEASCYLTQLDKQQSRKQLGITAGDVFLWVGRLNENKDPLTVLSAFEKYLTCNATAKLYMIYQTEELLPAVARFINKNSTIKRAVVLVGKVPHDELAIWYSAADFFVSASHREGSGYALLEAMACGCIPVVTAIPSFIKITTAGEAGFLYPVSDENYLLEILKGLDSVNKENMSLKVLQHFKNNLSFEKIADDLYNLCSKLNSK
jgi:glycosyltransferase involved in cell wall biosynthesis